MAGVGSMLVISRGRTGRALGSIQLIALYERDYNDKVLSYTCRNEYAPLLHDAAPLVSLVYRQILMRQWLVGGWNAAAW